MPLFEVFLDQLPQGTCVWRIHDLSPSFHYHVVICTLPQDRTSSPSSVHKYGHLSSRSSTSSQVSQHLLRLSGHTASSASRLIVQLTPVQHPETNVSPANNRKQELFVITTRLWMLSPWIVCDIPPGFSENM
jgi:hypothetical protein